MSYGDCLSTEREGLARVKPWLTLLWGPLVPVSERTAQKVGGDFLATLKGFVEVKTERTSTGSFFFETASNWDAARNAVLTPGWLYSTDQTDVLVYGFLDEPCVYVFPDYQHTRAWVIGHLGEFAERRQTAHSQRNTTIGRLVPIERALREGRGLVLAATRDPR